MNKKGFTLIELLAVIVILAIIALIVTPVVSNIVSNAKKAANARSVEGHIKNIELAIISKAFSGATTGEIDDYDSDKSPAKTKAEIEALVTSSTEGNIQNDKVTCASYVIKHGTVQSASTCTVTGTNAWNINYNYDIKTGASVAS